MLSLSYVISRKMLGFLDNCSNIQLLISLLSSYIKQIAHDA
jgi:hypothetical protein